MEGNKEEKDVKGVNGVKGVKSQEVEVKRKAPKQGKNAESGFNKKLERLKKQKVEQDQS